MFLSVASQSVCLLGLSNYGFNYVISQKKKKEKAI